MLQTSDPALFTFYIRLANIDLPEYYLLLVAAIWQRVLQLWVDVAVLRSRNSRHHSGLPSFAP
jgi:hypothetical protein